MNWKHVLKFGEMLLGDIVNNPKIKLMLALLYNDLKSPAVQIAIGEALPLIAPTEFVPVLTHIGQGLIEVATPPLGNDPKAEKPAE
jgi:hypothetical protein